MSSLLLKGNPNMRLALYIVSIVVNGAALYVRTFEPGLGDALQYVGGALAAITGAVAIGNVEREPQTQRMRRIAKETVEPMVSELPTRCDYTATVDGQERRCLLVAGHPLTYGHDLGR